MKSFRSFQWKRGLADLNPGAYRAPFRKTGTTEPVAWPDLGWGEGGVYLLDSGHGSMTFIWSLVTGIFLDYRVMSKKKMLKKDCRNFLERIVVKPCFELDREPVKVFF